MSQIDGPGMGVATAVAIFGITGKARQKSRFEGADISTSRLAALLDDAVLSFSHTLWREIRRGLDQVVSDDAISPVLDDFELAYPESNPAPVSEALSAAGGELPLHFQQGVDIVLIRFSLAGGLVELRLVEIELEEGSLDLKKLRGALVGQGAGLAVVIFLLSPTWTETADNARWTASITRMMDGQICETRLSAHYDIEELRGMAVEDLMVEGAVTSTEAQLRICSEQLLLRLNKSYPGAIDGVDGDETDQARIHFASTVGLSAEQIRSRRYYEALLDGIHPRP